MQVARGSVSWPTGGRRTWSLIAVGAVALASTAWAVPFWNYHGPLDCEQSEGLNRSCAGRTNCFLVNPSDPTMVLAGNSTGGLWRTTSSGSSWKAIKDGAIGALAWRESLGPQNPGRVLLGTGDWTYTEIYADGIWSSTDWGNTWEKVASWPETDRTKVRAIAVDAAGMICYAATTNKGLLRSTNGGINNSWISMSAFAGTEIWEVAAHPSATQFALLATSSAPAGIHRTTDGGATWSRVSLESFWPSQTTFGRTRFAWSTSNPNIVYAAVLNRPTSTPTARDNMLHAVGRSTDGGITWVPQWDQDLCAANCSPLSVLNNDKGSRLAFGVSSTNSDVLLLGGLQGAMYSTDGDATNGQGVWTYNPQNAGHADWHAIVPASGGFWVGNDGGIYWYTDSAPPVPTRRNTNYYTLQFYHISVDPTDQDLVYGGTQDNGSWARNLSGGTQQPLDVWDHIGPITDGYENVAHDWCLGCTEPPGGDECPDESAVYFWANSGLFRSCDGGVTTNSMPSPSGGWQHGPLFPDQEWPDSVLWGWITTPSPPASPRLQLWKLGTGSPVNVFDTGIGNNTRCADMARNLPRRMYVHVGLTQFDHRVWRIEHVAGGDNWAAAENLTKPNSQPPPWGSRIPYSIEVGAGYDAATDVVWVTFADYQTPNVYRWAENTWTSLATGGSINLPAEPIYRLETKGSDVDCLFAGSLHGVYGSSDGGASWSEIYNGQGIPDVPTYDLAYHAGSDRLYVGTHGRGIYWTYASNAVNCGLPDLARGDSRKDVEIRVDGRRLLFLTEAESDVTITLHDVTGRLVRRVLEAPLESGEHDAWIDDTNLANGIYFARLLVDRSQVGSARVVIMK